jgi:hypothetical protein
MKKGKLLQERIDLLNNTEGWKWEQEDPFEESLADWGKQFLKLGRSPRLNSQNADENRAAKWQSHNRENYKNGELSKERMDLLNNTEGWKWVHLENRAKIITKTFEESLDYWKQQFMMLGSIPIQNSENVDEKRAAKWQSHNRDYYKKGELSKERIELLNNTEGWKWVHSENRAKIITKTFEENVADWVKQFSNLRRTPKVTSENTEEKRAATWHGHVRKNYKKGELSKERIELLNNIEGWKWVHSENKALKITKTFEENLSDWVKQFSNLRRTPKVTSENTEEKRAATWHGHVRNDYKKGELSKERIELLNNTVGWKWTHR